MIFFPMYEETNFRNLENNHNYVNFTQLSIRPNLTQFMVLVFLFDQNYNF